MLFGVDPDGIVSERLGKLPVVACVLQSYPQMRVCALNHRS